MIGAYRLLVVLNTPVLALALLLAISVLPDLGGRYFTTSKAIMLIWPIPQIIGFWIAAKAKRTGEIARACWILLAQFVTAGGLTAAWFAMLLAAFPS